MAYPRVNIDDPEKNEKIEGLNKAALPYRMTLAPIRMVNDNDRKIYIYSIEECKKERDEIKQKNIGNSPELKIYTLNFNIKYAKSFNIYLEKVNKTYTHELHNIYDAFLSNYWDSRKMEDFHNKTNLNFTELNDDCFRFFRILYLYGYHGDKEKALAHVNSSKLMRELIYYMKRRLDSHITEEDEDANYKDYSYPRMLMISGHDSTVSSNLIFLINALDLDEEQIYTYPQYASQLALEVRTNKTITKSSTYKGYYVIGYFDDNKMFEVNADDFNKKIEGYIWSDEKINEFCGFEEAINTITKNKDNEDKSDNVKTAYKILMSIFICLSAIFLTSTIFLGYKLYKTNKAHPSIDQKEHTRQTNSTVFNLKIP